LREPFHIVEGGRDLAVTWAYVITSIDALVAAG
jgi:hypothetical protein